MVFNVTKYTNKIDELLRADDPQTALEEWITVSPRSGKPLAKSTAFTRKTVLRKYLKEQDLFDYKIDDQEVEEYKKFKDDQFAKKTTTTVNMTKINDFLDTMDEKLGDSVDVSKKDLDEYFSSKRTMGRQTTSNFISNVMFYLMLTSGRRISEFFNLYKGFDDGNLKFKLAKKNSEAIENIKPLIAAKRWDSIYKSIKPILERDTIETLTTRLNRFVKTIDPKFTTHSLRKVYAELCSRKRNKKTTTKVSAIKKCLNHQNADSSLRYEIKTKKTKKCDNCDKEISAKNWARHIKSVKHNENARR